MSALTGSLGSSLPAGCINQNAFEIGPLLGSVTLVRDQATVTRWSYYPLTLLSSQRSNED